MNQANLDRALFNLLRKIELCANVLRDFRGKWNNRLRAGFQIQPANLSVLVINNFLSAREKRIARKKVARKNGFLVVAGHRIAHPVVFSSLQLSQTEPAFGFVASNVQQEFSIWRQEWTHRAAGLLDDRVLVAGLAVFALDLPKRKHGVVREVPFAFGVVEIAAVRRSHHAHVAGTLVARSGGRWFGFGDLDTRAAVHVVHPDFARTDAEFCFGHVDIFPGGIPAGRREFVAGIFRDLLGAAAIGLHDPDVFAAFAVREKSNPLTIGRKSWLAVERHSAVNQLGLAAFDRQRIDVAYQFERDGLSVRRDIQRKPGAFVGGEGNLAVGLQRQAFFLVFLLILLFIFLLFFLRDFLRVSPRNSGEAETERQNHHIHHKRPPVGLHAVHAVLLQDVHLVRNQISSMAAVAAQGPRTRSDGD